MYNCDETFQIQAFSHSQHISELRVWEKCSCERVMSRIQLASLIVVTTNKTGVKILIAFWPKTQLLLGRKLSQIGENTIFVEKTFVDCSLLLCQRTPHPKFHSSKTFANSHKTAKFAQVFSLKSFPPNANCFQPWSQTSYVLEFWYYDSCSCHNCGLNKLTYTASRYKVIVTPEVLTQDICRVSLI